MHLKGIKIFIISSHHLKIIIDSNISCSWLVPGSALYIPQLIYLNLEKLQGADYYHHFQIRKLTYFYLSLKKYIFSGNAGKNPIRVADDIINAIVDFTQKHSTPSLQKVKVVVLTSELLNAFRDTMKKREIAMSPPILQRTFSKTACKTFFKISLISLRKCLDMNAHCFYQFQDFTNNLV